jgi:hypothetical protein
MSLGHLSSPSIFTHCHLLLSGWLPACAMIAADWSHTCLRRHGQAQSHNHALSDLIHLTLVGVTPWKNQANLTTLRHMYLPSLKAEPTPVFSKTPLFLRQFFNLKKSAGAPQVRAETTEPQQLHSIFVEQTLGHYRQAPKDIMATGTNNRVVRSVLADEPQQLPQTMMFSVIIHPELLLADHALRSVDQPTQKQYNAPSDTFSEINKKTRPFIAQPALPPHNTNATANRLAASTAQVTEVNKQERLRLTLKLIRAEKKLSDISRFVARAGQTTVSAPYDRLESWRSILAATHVSRIKAGVIQRFADTIKPLHFAFSSVATALPTPPSIQVTAPISPLNTALPVLLSPPDSLGQSALAVVRKTVSKTTPRISSSPHHVSTANVDCLMPSRPHARITTWQHMRSVVLSHQNVKSATNISVRSNSLPYFSLSAFLSPTSTPNVLPFSPLHHSTVSFKDTDKEIHPPAQQRHRDALMVLTKLSVQQPYQVAARVQDFAPIISPALPDHKQPNLSSDTKLGHPGEKKSLTCGKVRLSLIQQLQSSQPPLPTRQGPNSSPHTGTSSALRHKQSTPPLIEAAETARENRLLSPVPIRTVLSAPVKHQSQPAITITNPAPQHHDKSIFSLLSDHGGQYTYAPHWFFATTASPPSTPVQRLAFTPAALTRKNHGLTDRSDPFAGTWFWTPSWPNEPVLHHHLTAINNQSISAFPPPRQRRQKIMGKRLFNNNPYLVSAMNMVSRSVVKTRLPNAVSGTSEAALIPKLTLPALIVAPPTRATNGGPNIDAPTPALPHRPLIQRQITDHNSRSTGVPSATPKLPPHSSAQRMASTSEHKAVTLSEPMRLSVARLVAESLTQRMPALTDDLHRRLTRLGVRERERKGS